MTHIQYATKFLQTRKLSLAGCRGSLDMLIDDVEAGKNDPNSDLYRCTLGKKYIAPHADILPYKHFETGVYKIQEGTTSIMTLRECNACQRLLMYNVQGQGAPAPAAGGNVLGNNDGNLSYAERIEQRKRQRTDPAGYRNVDFILGSAAEVERLWSHADNILTDNRKNTTPLLFEALIFLKINERLWDVHLTKEAYHLKKSKHVEDLLEEEQQNENDDDNIAC